MLPQFAILANRLQQQLLVLMDALLFQNVNQQKTLVLRMLQLYLSVRLEKQSCQEEQTQTVVVFLQNVREIALS